MKKIDVTLRRFVTWIDEAPDMEVVLGAVALTLVSCAVCIGLMSAGLGGIAAGIAAVELLAMIGIAAWAATLK